MRETIGFLLTILVAHLLEPLLAPLATIILAVSENLPIPHIGLLTFLGINLTAILTIFLAAILRWASNGIGMLIIRYAVRRFRKQPPT